MLSESGSYETEFLNTEIEYNQNVSALKKTTKIKRQPKPRKQSAQSGIHPRNRITW
jgi:hypothetical protein